MTHQKPAESGGSQPITVNTSVPAVRQIAELRSRLPEPPEGQIDAAAALAGSGVKGAAGGGHIEVRWSDGQEGEADV